MLLQPCESFKTRERRGQTRGNNYLVMINDHAFDDGVQLDHSLKVLNTVIADLADVQEARHAADLDECPIWLDCFHHTLGDEEGKGQGCASAWLP